MCSLRPYSLQRREKRRWAAARLAGEQAGGAVNQGLELGDWLSLRPYPVRAEAGEAALGSRCAWQESKLAVLWNIGVFALNFGPVFVGPVLDWVGPKLTAMLGACPLFLWHSTPEAVTGWPSKRTLLDSRRAGRHERHCCAACFAQPLLVAFNLSYSVQGRWST